MSIVLAALQSIVCSLDHKLKAYKRLQPTVPIRTCPWPPRASSTLLWIRTFKVSRPILLSWSHVKALTAKQQPAEATSSAVRANPGRPSHLASNRFHSYEHRRSRDRAGASRSNREIRTRTRAEVDLLRSQERWTIPSLFIPRLAWYGPHFLITSSNRLGTVISI